MMSPCRRAGGRKRTRQRWHTARVASENRKPRGHAALLGGRGRAPCSPRPSCASCRGCGTGAWCRRCTAPPGGRCLRAQTQTDEPVSALRCVAQRSEGKARQGARTEHAQHLRILCATKEAAGPRASAAARAQGARRPHVRGAAKRHAGALTLLRAAARSWPRRGEAAAEARLRSTARRASTAEAAALARPARRHGAPWPSSLKTSSRFSSFSFLPRRRFLPPLPARGGARPERQPCSAELPAHAAKRAASTAQATHPCSSACRAGAPEQPPVRHRSGRGRQKGRFGDVTATLRVAPRAAGVANAAQRALWTLRTPV